MVKYIKDQFKNSLASLDWMDEETRKSALDKANTIVDHIAYPDELLEDKKIIELFEKVCKIQSANITLLHFDSWKLMINNICIRL